MNKRYLTLAVPKVIMPNTSGVIEFEDGAVIDALKSVAIKGENIVLVPKKVGNLDSSITSDAPFIFGLNQKGDLGTLVGIDQIIVDPFEMTAKITYNRGKLVKIGEPFLDDAGLCFSAPKKITFTYNERDMECRSLIHHAATLSEQFVKNADFPIDVHLEAFNEGDPVPYMDALADIFPVQDKYTYYFAERFMDKLMAYINMATLAVEFQRVDDTVSEKVKDAIDQNQREYYVREQIRALNAEIDGEDEVEEYCKKIDSLIASDEVKNKLRKEARRINQTAPASPEMALLKNYLDTVLELPWGIYTEDNEDLGEAERVLNADHYGLEKVKERLVEALAVRKLSKEGRSPIICLVGPPGIGKTSIARSIATAMHKNYVRLSFGGVRDEAEIRGHRKTYVGAMPGRIITGIKTAGSMNPVFLIDEIDKMSSDYKGDPASALLEVLDPEQNVNFRDHFVEMSFDLSKVLFIVTANTLETISTPLLDRMEVIEMSGYTDLEKMEIAKRYLVPKSEKQCGVQSNWVQIEDDAIKEIINSYTHESGVRGLEKSLNAVMRKIARRHVSDENTPPAVVKKENLFDYLGEKRYLETNISKEDEVGVVTGLAWTEAGGDTLSVEVAIASGKGELQLTGNLGDVMKESARIAVSYCRTKSESLGLASDYFETHDIHIHVPEGATPKDGPSAGVTLTTALTSALTGKSVKHTVAMTGEVTLLGKVLAIGGLKEKSLAALRAGIKTIYLPEENRKDHNELPQVVKDNIEFIFTKNVKTILDGAINW